MTFWGYVGPMLGRLGSMLGPCWVISNVSWRFLEEKTIFLTQTFSVECFWCLFGPMSDQLWSFLGRDSVTKSLPSETWYGSTEELSQIERLQHFAMDLARIREVMEKARPRPMQGSETEQTRNNFETDPSLVWTVCFCQL